MNEANATLALLTHPKSVAAEAYRTLRTNVQFASLDQPLRTLLITSPGPEEGKTTTLANLGIAFAQAGTRVLLVDCDLRRPSLHVLFDVANERGLTSYLLDETGEPAIQSTNVEGLSLLPTGPLPHNPSELLASRRMECALDALVERADLVLLDSPPVVAVSDAAVLGRRVDGVLLVVSVGRTRREHAAQARRVLERANVRILGAVMNNAQLDSALYRYYG